MADAPTALLPTGAVLIAHGPTGATLTALKRTARVVAPGAPIVVVAGAAPAATAVERAADQGASSVDGYGPEAIAEAIETLGVTMPLVLHDDVDIDRQAVSSMLRAAGRSGVPAIPADRPSVSQTRVERASLHCVVGASDVLVDLARSAAFMPGMQVNVAAVVAAEAGHRHLGECVDRLEGPDAADGRPLLVAAMIVRDEEEYLAGCLESLHGLVDRIEIADTGSTDATVEIATANGAHVTPVEWRADFGWARNQVLERCRDAHLVIWIDADERVDCDDPTELRRFLNTYRGFHDAYQVRIDNTSGGMVTHVHSANRIIDPARARFVGELHERPCRLDGSDVAYVDLSALRITHLGYDAAVVEQRDKRARNLAIARSSFDAEPSAERAVNYCKALAGDLTDPARSLAEMDRVLPDLDVIASVPVRANLLALRGRLELALGRPADAMRHSLHATELVPADAVAGAVLAESLVRLGRHHDALDRAADLASRRSVTPVQEDHVAATTRSAALVRAALATGRTGDLRTHLAGLGAEQAPHVDPWPQVLRVVDEDVLVLLAEDAGARGDWRFVRGVGDAGGLSLAVSEAARVRYRRNGGDLHDAERRRVAAEAIDRPWRHARERFIESGAAADAITYARMLGAQVDGDTDDDIEQVERVVARAMEAASARHVEAGRPTMAVEDAIVALGNWAGATSAALLAAHAAIDAGMAEVALDVIAACRASTSGEQGHAHDLARAATLAYLALGETGRAAAEAVSVVEEGGRLGCWSELLSAATDDQALTLVLGLALIGDAVSMVDAAARTLAPERTAVTCLAYLASGGSEPAAVTTGILAASITGRDDLAALFAEHLGLVDESVRASLVASLVEQEHLDLARTLETAGGPASTGGASTPSVDGFRLD